MESSQVSGFVVAAVNALELVLPPPHAASITALAHAATRTGIVGRTIPAGMRGYLTCFIALSPCQYLALVIKLEDAAPFCPKRLAKGA